MDLKLPNYNTAYISFSAEISVTTTEQLAATATQLVGQGFNCLYFLFSTQGGAVMNGMNLYNVHRRLPAKIIFHNQLEMWTRWETLYSYPATGNMRVRTLRLCFMA